ncbi:SDR family oxidoreductase [Gammaproteobacteria bacterium]|nr:SDR family oxidoreductase [Gammaproteobacteria bacterium]MDA9011343.1 SDR family oxidoreductase [Gammaproteobacteria bacterium]MDA9118102.1 SDR family oxidoreductase [Gammaproteobacteria bacterium]
MKQTILITGGTGKFGRNFVRHFSLKGWQVIFTTTSKSRGDDLINQLENPINTVYLVADFTKPTAINELVNEVSSKGYSVNHLVNNARNMNTLKINELGQSNREDFMGEYLMDVIVPYELSIGFYNKQFDSLNTVTNISSQYGLVAANPNLYDDYFNQSAIQYGVAKSALNHLTKELAVRMAKKNIRVNCIAYGGVEGRVDEDFKSRYAALTPSARMLEESEIAGPLDFLVGQDSTAFTGQILVADGGWTIW